MAKSKNRKGHKQRVQSRNQRISEDINRQRKAFKTLLESIEKNKASAETELTSEVEEQPSPQINVQQNL
jgi:hypothetical protein